MKRYAYGFKPRFLIRAKRLAFILALASDGELFALFLFYNMEFVNALHLSLK